MFRYLFILSLIILHLPSGMVSAKSALAQQSFNVRIKGKADTSYLSATNKIHVFTYDDYISFSEKELASDTMDIHGNFSLSFSIPEASYIYLMVDNAKAEMAAEPNNIYEIIFLPKDSDAVHTLSMSVPVEIEFTNSHETELNFLLADFTGRYEAFLEFHSPLLAKQNPVIFGKIDTMHALCTKKYSVHNNQYLTTYIDYTFALLEESITLKEKEKVLGKYITGKPVLLNNYKYMTFFNTFFSVTANYFMATEKMKTEVNKQDFSSLMHYFKQSKLLTNDTIREAVILKSLSEYSRNPVYKLNSILILLDQANKQCKAEKNKKSAENLKKKLSVMKIGDPAPQLTFLDKDGKAVTLADFSGKYIYLNFWASWCTSCIQQMMLLPELKKLYGNKITFVSISVDKKPETMQNFLKKNEKLNWEFLYCDNYKKAKEQFNALTVPSYYLIDPKGNVLRAPAETPIDIEPVFNQIKKRK